MDNWVKIFESTQMHEIQIVKAMLDDNEIHSVEINKSDSAYPSFGEIELYVMKENAVRAMYLISKEIS